jgi:predicted nucleotide-binding protein
MGESDFQKWDRFYRNSALKIKMLFGENSQYLHDWLEIEIPEEPERDDHKGFYTYQHKKSITKDKMENQLDIMAKEIALSVNEEPVTNGKNRNKVFIVHGTDHGPVNDLKDILKEANLQPLILEDLPCASKTIVEKLETYSDVDFAFVIITPDDMGSLYLGKKHGQDTTGKLNFRARQNVILEFGYFIAKLGRKKVCYLVKGEIEIPSDMNGIAYIPFNVSIKEIKQKILNELGNAEVI